MPKITSNKLFLSSLVVLVLTLSFSQVALAKESFSEKDTNWSKDKIKRYIKLKFSDRSDKEVKKIIAVFTAESGLRCDAKSKTNDIGVAQINQVHWKKFGGKDKLKRCKANIDAAKQIYKDWGNSLKPWSTYNNGRYKKYL